MPGHICMLDPKYVVDDCSCSHCEVPRAYGCLFKLPRLVSVRFAVGIGAILRLHARMCACHATTAMATGLTPDKKRQQDERIQSLSFTRGYRTSWNCKLSSMSDGVGCSSRARK
jgi:hypothetical protein